MERKLSRRKAETPRELKRKNFAELKNKLFVEQEEEEEAAPNIEFNFFFF